METEIKPFNFVRITQGLDVEPLLRAIQEHPELWDEFNDRQDYPGSPHKDTQCIFLRWCEEKTVEAVFEDNETIDYPAMKILFPEVQKLLSEICSILSYRLLGRVIITELRPGGIIAPHIDEGAYADKYERFHVPLFAEQRNLFFIGTPLERGEYRGMDPGDLYCFNHKRQHWFVNQSDKPRIHLIIDAVCPEYRQERK